MIIRNQKGGAALKVLLVVAVIAGLSIIGFVGGIFNKGVKTASKMADQTIFNADKHVWTYEKFRANVADFDQHMTTWTGSAKRCKSLEEKGKDDTQSYDNAVMMRDGAWQMMARIAGDYNKMSAVAYQKIWKGQLPERLDMPSIDEIM